MPTQLPTPIPASAFDGDCGVSFAVALYQRVDVRLRGDSEAFRGRVVGITHDPERGVTLDVALEAPIVYPAIDGVCRAYEQWRLTATLDEVFPVPHASAARDAAIEALIATLGKGTVSGDRIHFDECELRAALAAVRGGAA